MNNRRVNRSLLRRRNSKVRPLPRATALLESLECRHLLAADIEPNDSFAQAVDLGTGSQTHTDPAIQIAGDQDWFKWTATTDGSVRVDVLFSQQQSDLALRLFDDSQVELASSDTITDNERASVEISPGEEFFVSVSGFQGAIGSYDLVITEIPIDAFDVAASNDTLATATDLVSTIATYAGATIHRPADQDFYKWTAPANGVFTVDVRFAHAAGDVNLFLLDSEENVLDSGESATDDERIVMDVDAGQELFVKIVEGGGTEHPLYDLSVDFVSPPVLSDLGLIVSNFDSPTTISFTVDDDDDPVDSLILVGVSSNQAIVPDENIVFGGSGVNRTMTLTPVFPGVTTITLMAHDGGRGIDEKQFDFHAALDDPNDPPTISNISDQTIDEDTTTGAISFAISDPQDAASELTITASSSDSDLIPTENITVVNGGFSSTVTVTPAPNLVGEAVVTLTVEDQEGVRTSETFSVTVNPVEDPGENDPPTFDPIGELTIAEDSTSHAVAITGLGPGGGIDEAGQLVTLSVATSDPFLIPQPTVSGTTISFDTYPHRVGTATITVTAQDDGGGADTFRRTFDVHVTQINDPPMMTELLDQSEPEDEVISLDFTAGDLETPPSLLTYTASSSNIQLVDINKIVFDGSSTRRSVQITPEPNQSGTAVITVKVSDGEFFVTSEFVVTVAAVDDPPTISDISDQTVDEDSVLALTFSVGDVETPADELVVTAMSSNQELVADSAIVLEGTGSERSISITPNGNASGTTTITISVSDGNLTTFETFDVAGNPVNDAPSFTKGPDQTVLEDADAQSVTGWATDISPGPADESGQAVAFSITNNTNPGLFAVEPAISADGELTYTLADNAHGSASITAVLVDDGGTDNGGIDTSPPQIFTINVTPVNDAPSFTKGADQLVIEDSGALTIDDWATDISLGPGDVDQTVTFNITNNTNPDLFAGAPVITPAGQLTFIPAPDANGSATITVVLSDNGGTANGGEDTSASQTFTISVTPVNDVPSFTGGVDQTVLEDAGPQAIDAWASLIDPGPNENGQAVSFQVTDNTNPSLFATPPAISPTGRLTFTPAANAHGSASITVVLTDDGGTADGGVDTSAPRTFAINVSSVNDVPSFTKGADQTVLEDSGAQTVANWANEISAGSNEITQGVVFNITDNTNPDLFAGLPVISPSGELTYTPITNAHGSAVITVELADNGGTANGGVDTSAPQTFTIHIAPVNDIPSFTGGPDQTVLEDAGPQTVEGWATAIDTGANEPSQTVSFHIVGNTNPDLFANPPAISPTGQLSYTPASDAHGSASVTVELMDDGGAADGGVDTSISRTFTINVSSVNDAPSFTKGADQTVLEDAGGQAVTGWATGIVAEPGVSTQNVTFDVTGNTNPGLFAGLPVISPTGQLIYTPAPHAHGSASITVQLVDDGGTANGGLERSEPQTFTINVTPVNDAPSFSGGPNQTVLEDTGPQVVDGWATAIAVGPNEPSQSATFEVVGNTNPSLFAVGPVISPAGQLSYDPAPDANGSASITVVLRDDGGTSDGGVDSSGQRTFTISISPVNDVPSFTKGADQTVLEDAGAQLINGWATAISAGPGDLGQNVTFDIIGNTNPALFVTAPTISPLGQLSYESAPDANGSASITVELVDDGGTANGGVDRSVSQTFTINVTPVNDAPSFAVGGDQTVLEDAAAQSVDGWATNISVGPANESSQTVSFHVTSNTNPSLFTSGPTISPTGQLTYSLAAGAHGSASIGVAATDSGDAANGGQNTSGKNTSGTQTFTIHVTPVNDAPSFTKGVDQVVAEDAGLQTVDAWATGISPGANDTQQAVAFRITGNTNPALFAAAPAISPNGQLTYGPADDVHGTATITAVIADDGGTDHGGLDTSAPQTFTISVTAVNDAPTFTIGADQSVLEDAGLQTVEGWAGAISAGPNEAEQNVAFRITDNTNPGLFASAPSISPSGQLSYAPAAATSGTASVTVALVDDGGTENGGVDTSASQTFTISVVGVNDAPSFTKGPDQTVLEDAGLQTITAWATDITAGASESGQAVAFHVTGNSNPSLFASGPTISATGELSYTPVADMHGSASITATLVDNGGTDNGGVDTSAAETFTITVTSVNDVPSFVRGDDQAVLEDAGAQTIDSWATAISAGAREGDQLVTFNIIDNTNPSLFAAAPAISPAGQLSYTPAANASGSASITIALVDDGGTVNGGIALSASQTFTINVTSVNDAPTFAKGTDLSQSEDAGPRTISGWATDIDAGAGEVEQNVAFLITDNTNPGLFAAAPTISADGELSYTAAEDAHGVAVITVALADDGGTANGGSDTSDPQTFTINVAPINDAPSFSGGLDQSISEDAGLQTLGGWASGISAGAGETDQNVSFVVTSNSNPGLFSQPPTISPTGQLSYAPVADASGSASITVVLMDAAGTTGGGINSSAPHVFTIDVAAVNDAPSFTKGADQTVLGGPFEQAVDGWATAIRPGPVNESGQRVDFVVTGNTNPGLFATPPAISSSGRLTYTPTVTADGSADITVVLRDSGGTANGGVDTSAPQIFTITVTPVNEAPSFTKGADQIVAEDAGPQTVTNWASGISPGANEAHQAVTFEVTGNTNPGLFSDAPTISPSGQLNYTPAPNAHGTAVITAVLMDDGGTANGGVDTSVAQTFTITVTSVNDVPSFLPGPNQTIREDVGAQTISGWASGISAGPADEAGQAVAFSVTGNTNPGLFSTAPSISPTGQLTYRPAADAHGSAVITVVALDDGGANSSSESFTIEIAPINDAPSFIGGADQTVLRGGGVQAVDGWATSISAGANEAAQEVTFTVTANTNPTLFAVPPAISSSGRLTYTPAADQHGEATITVALMDDGGTADGGANVSASHTFTINVISVNSAPSFTKGADQVVDEDAGARTITAWATDITAGPGVEANQAVAFNIIGNTNPDLFAVAPSISPEGTLTYTPAANAHGSAAITVVLMDDGGAANGGVDISAPQTFNVDVASVNDAPTFTKGADQTVQQSAGTQAVFGWATSISAGPVDESSQTLTFRVVANTDPSLFADGPAISPTGRLSYTPAPDAAGTALVTVVLADSGGTTDGGADTSAAQTFRINVLPINRSPSFTKGADQTVNEDAGLQSLAGWASDISAGPGESDQNVTFNIVGNTNPDLFASAPRISPTGQLTYRTAANAHGSAAITVVLTDDGGTFSGGIDRSSPQTFTIDVVPVNDAPRFDRGADQTVLADAGPQTVERWATSISAGPSNERGQTVAFEMTNNSNPGLFAVAPAISPTGTLTYTPAIDADGTASITVALMDDGGTGGGGVDRSNTLTFRINVLPIDDTAIPPRVVAVDRNGGDGRFDHLTSVSFQFNKDVSPSLESSDFVIADVLGTPIELQLEVAVSWDPATKTASFRFSDMDFPLGRYLTTLKAEGLEDLDRNQLDGDGDGVGGDDFHAEMVVTYRGDIDLDLDVDFADFLILASRFGQGDATWHDGDFDGNGIVEFPDFLAMGGNFGNKVEIPPAAASAGRVDAASVAMAFATSDDKDDSPWWLADESF